MATRSTPPRDPRTCARRPAAAQRVVLVCVRLLTRLAPGGRYTVRSARLAAGRSRSAPSRTTSDPRRAAGVSREVFRFCRHLVPVEDDLTTDQKLIAYGGVG